MRVTLVFSCLFTAFCAGGLSGCSTAKPKVDAEQAADAGKEGDKEGDKKDADTADTKDADKKDAGTDNANIARAQVAELKAALSSMTSRLDSIETRMGSLNDKFAGTQNSLETLMSNHKAVATPIRSHPSTGAGTEPPVPLADNDPEAGFVADAAIQDYRKGSILLEAQKYPEAILAFSSFVERYPDHPLAGSAQFGIGKSYFKQKEFKLALKELERVLTSYDRSPHISDTLRHLVETEEALKMPEQAARHRHLLTSLFAQSPAASASLVIQDPDPAPKSALPTAPLAAPSVAAPAAGKHGAP